MIVLLWSCCTLERRRLVCLDDLLGFRHIWLCDGLVCAVMDRQHNGHTDQQTHNQFQKVLRDDGENRLQVSLFGKARVQGQLPAAQQPYEHPSRGHGDVIKLLEIQQQKGVRKIDKCG